MLEINELETQNGSLFNALFSEADGVVELRGIDKASGQLVRLFSRDQNERSEWIEQHSEQYNLYYGLCTRKPNSKSGKKEDCYEIVTYWADVDFKDYPGGEQEAREVLRQFPLQPSAIVASGGGLHLYWIFRELELIDGNIATHEARMRGIAKILRADHTFDVSRVFRIPGTINYPNAKKQALGRTEAPCVLEFLGDSRYNPDDFDVFADVIVESVEKSPVDISGTIPSRFQADLNSDQYFREVWEGVQLICKAGAQQVDRSRQDSRLTHRLIKLGYNDGEIAALLMQYKHGKAHEQKDAAGYISSTIADARGDFRTNLASHLQNDEWRETKPLQRPLTPPAPFPIDTLGPLLGNVTKKLSEVIQAPVAICAQSILAATALAVQAHADISIDGRNSPISEFFMTIGESGERKSAVDNCALWAHRKHQTHLKEVYEREFIQFQNALDVYTKARNEVLAKKNKTSEERRSALDALGDPPRPPIEPFLTTEEPTYEGLVKMLANGQPSVGLFSDEGGRFIGGHALNSDNMLKTASGLSGLWDGKAISRVRAGDGSSLLLGRRFSFHLMAQPSISQLMLSNSLLLEQGFLSRCLVAWPGSTAGTRKYVEVDLSRSSDVTRYWARMSEILEAPPPLAEGKQNELEPRPLYLSPEAKQCWIEFHNQVESKLADNEPFSPIRGLANKAPEHAARLAGILALVEDLHCPSIGLTHIQSGIALISHYLNEALRLFNAGIIDPDLALAERLLQWLRKRNDPVISLVEVYQFGINAIRNAQTARKIMNILVDHGWAKTKTDGTLFGGTMRKEAWDVNL